MIKKINKTKRLLSLVLITLIGIYAFSSLSNSLLDLSYSEEKTKIVYDGKLSNQSYCNLSLNDSDENITDEYVLTIQYKPQTDFTCNHLSRDLSGEYNIYTVEERNDYRLELKNYFSDESDDFIQSHNIGNYDEMEISFYTPHIRYHFTELNNFLNQENFINTIDNDNSIELVYIGTEEKLDLEATRNTTDSVEYSWSSLLSDYGLLNVTKTGLGINVGNLEPYIPDNMSNFDNSNQNSTYGSSTGNHARVVATIHGGNNGIAP